jgi:hypothetical protein
MAGLHAVGTKWPTIVSNDEVEIDEQLMKNIARMMESILEQQAITSLPKFMAKSIS